MPEKKAFKVGCASGTRIDANYVTISNFHIRHNNNSRVVQNACGGNCSFPDCMEQVIQQAQAAKSHFAISDDNRIRAENLPHARSLFDERGAE